MRWFRSWRADPLAVPMADRHYNRQSIGAAQFVPPGRCVVLTTEDRRALWVTSWPYAEHVRHEWAGAWINSLFRYEATVADVPASVLIAEAVAATRAILGEPPPLGAITFIDPRAVAGFYRRTTTGRVLEWGYSYFMAGWQYAGWTKGGLFARRLTAEQVPAARAPLTRQPDLFTEAARA